MVYRFTQKFKRAIALFFVSIFYANLLFSAYMPFSSFNNVTINYSAGRHINYHTGEKINDNVPYTKIPVAYAKEKSVKNTVTNKSIQKHIGGPTQPEMSAFQSVNTNNMVDLFSGDFSYNIPLLDVGGYPVNLFYRSGITMDQEASWVGLGWNINPGTITRNLRGLPDDFEGSNDAITKVTSVKENSTTGATIGGDVELFGLMGLSAGVGAFYNNYRGWGVENSINTSISAGFANMGSLTAGLSLNNNSQEGLTISPSLDVGLSIKDADNKGDNGTLSIGGGLSFNSRTGLRASLSSGVNLSLSSIKNQSQSDGLQGTLYSSSMSFVSPSYCPTVSLPYTNSQYTFTLKLGSEATGLHPSGFVRGYQSTQKIDGADTLRVIPAYGYLNYQNAQGNTAALLDFNREKELVYHQKPDLPNIAIPSYTYDLFSISGEGTGGMFRAYRGDIGYVYDAAVTTKDNSDVFSADFGFGNLIHAGVNIEVTNANTTGGPWVDNNVMASTVGFKQSDSNYQSVYFKNPGEKSINAKGFYNAIGNEDVVTTGLYQSGSSLNTTSYLQHYRNKLLTGNSLLTPSNAYKPNRDKRTQVISYLNAGEATYAGLDKAINVYDVNQWGPALCSNLIHKEARSGGMRKPNHISEIDVLNADGKRYVYGLPVYNKLQDEVTYALNKTEGNNQTGLATYKAADDGPSNTNGKDNYYNRERIPAYAHSFLLTGILSPDYVDVKGDGITDDDIGDAIRINYSRVSDSVNAFSWRSPYINKVTYNEGLESYSRDDRGSYIYGEKELWYMNSIESKNMVAQFIVDVRSDLMPISKAGIIAGSTPAKELKEIRLYSKADLLKNGANAVPIKTVHFKYGYTLCQNANQSNQGKLTLEKIWFTYNGNDKGIKNPYTFNYDNINPNYDNRSYDRWGTYKSAADNPHGNLTNAEYPYALQDSVLASKNAAAWTLDSIVLPSGGRMKVNYESDDYAFVQNKRAMQMLNVVGLSKMQPLTSHTDNSESDLQNSLYRYQKSVDHSEDNLFIGIKVPAAVSSNKEVYNKYLEGINTLYFKLKVTMPADEWGSGSEYVPCYADVDVSQTQYYGYLASDPTIIWVKIKGIDLQGEGDGDFSPLAKAAIQFLRLNLPSKAYPRSETTDNVSVLDAIQMVANIGASIVNSFSSFDRQARENNWAVTIDPDKSWVRLNTPGYKKYGGGLRVKNVMIYDNWHDMTDNQQKESVYGQEYNYTTVKNIDGEDKIISSGVASYEPMMGNDENPWRLPVEYIEKASALAPVTMGYSETPFGESFFPAASVGYSRVTVRSINIKGIRSANGYEETRFFTTNDFPTMVDNSMLNNDTKKHYNTSLGFLLKLNIKHYLAMSQGFKVELNDMNGKIRSQASFAQTDSLNPISYTENFYHVDDKNAEFKHLNNTMKSVNAQGLIDTTSLIGEDIELMMDMRQQDASTVANNYNLDLDAFIIGIFPIPVPSFIPLPQKEENLFRSAATTKIIQRYGILDSVVVIDKGSRISTENLLYDGETGDVVLTRTKNEFNDTIYNFNYPAHWEYSGMGLAYQNINDVFGGGFGTRMSVINGVLQSNSRYPGLNNYFESGDEVLVYGRKKAREDTAFSCTGQPSCISNGYASDYNYDVVWAVDSKKVDPKSSAGLLFLNRDGSPYSGVDVYMKIIRSGHRNLASNSIGSISSLKTPVKKVGTQLKLVLDSTINILNTSAAVYNEQWRVEDALYLKDTCVKQVKYGQAILNPTSITTLRYINLPDANIVYNGSNVSNTRLVAGYYYQRKRDVFGCHTQQKSIRTFFKFDLNALPSNAKIDYASLMLNAGSPRNTNFSSSEPADGLWDNQTFAHNFESDAGHNGAYLNLTSYYIGVEQNPYDVTYDNSDSATLSIPGSTAQSCANYSFNATKIITKLWNNKTTYTGFLLRDIDDHADFGKCTLGARHMSFCAGTDGINNSGCSNCTASSYVSINYHFDSADCYQVCRSAITQTNVNPYVHGILGNWRSNQSFVFYNSRAETNFSGATNIRKNGIIKTFIPYWTFTAAYLKPTIDTVSWVWNLQTTLYNRKGFEIENKDPLGRYNAGSYGYNETLPVSVTQNSRYQQQFFDGFEDYGYTTENCPVDCVLPRPMDFITGGGVLDSTAKHSGKYSLRVGSASSVSFTLGDPAKEKFALTSKLSFTDTTLTGKGTGLSLDYFKIGYYGWEGYLQPDLSAYYTIQSTTGSLSCAGNYTLTITSVDDPNDVVTAYSNTSNIASLQHQLYIGKLYKIEIHPVSCYFNDSNLTLKWSKQVCSPGTLVTVPVKNRYPSVYNGLPDTTGSLHVNVQSACARNDGFGADPNVLLPNFNPYAGDKMNVSAWVREDQNCLCDSFTHNSIVVTYYYSTGNTISQDELKPSGAVIEGWQRYDAVINIPSYAASVQLQLKSTGEYTTYFDDVRMLPFNANMKSFVYDPVSLRLMAELDEDNYATFYEYDNDGTLIRVKKETERGIQTIKETRSNLSEK